MTEKNFIDQNYIEVTGKAEMQIMPDLIYVKILLSERDTKNRFTIAELEKKMIAKFQELAIDVKNDLALNDLESFFKNKILSKSEIMLSKQYQLITHDAKMTSKIFAELASIGIANVSINNFDHSRIGEFKRLVKINAIKAAKEKADALARAVDQAIGRAIYIQEQGDPDYGYNYNYPQSNIQRRASSPGEMKEIVDVDLEKIKLDYSMLVRFELK